VYIRSLIFRKTQNFMAEEQEGQVEEISTEEKATPQSRFNYDSLEDFLEQNQKPVLGAAVALVLVIGVAIYMFGKYLPDENLKAQKATYMAEFAFGRDSFALALNGNATFKGFADAANKYGWTKDGKLANYYAGICCMNLKQYDKAIQYLDKFSTSDAILGALRLNLLGDAYAEQGKMDEAINYYEKAAGFSDNEKYTPYFLFKTGEAYEKQKKYADAKKAYEKIRDKYPMSDEAQNIEKYIARASAAAQ
jgi:tetratricopeptide (TPR) repeat protein